MSTVSSMAANRSEPMMRSASDVSCLRPIPTIAPDAKIESSVISRSHRE